MANRWLNQFKKTMEKEVVSLYARVSIGASGAPTLDAKNSKGIVSITRSSAGKYVVVFGTKAGMLDTYNRLLLAEVCFDESSNSGTAPAAPLMYIFAQAVSTPASASVTVQFTNSTGVATDPANGEVILLEFILRNSNAP